MLAAGLEAIPALGGVRRDLDEPAARAESRTARADAEAVIVDERAQPLAAFSSGEPTRVREIPRSDAPDVQPVEIAIRDERPDAGPAAWIGLIGAQLERFRQDSVPFAVLLVELLDIERMRRAGHGEDIARMADQMERALTGALGTWTGSLTRERLGRCWLVAPETDIVGAELLAERLARAVATRSSHRGATLEVAIGAAVCPEHGREASALAAHADVGAYAARSRAHAPAGAPGVLRDESV
jgi:hypothetical protein